MSSIRLLTSFCFILSILPSWPAEPAPDAQIDVLARPLHGAGVWLLVDHQDALLPVVTSMFCADSVHEPAKGFCKKEKTKKRKKVKERKRKMKMKRK